MNSRGQAALEYLMTYGWALIVIAIVVGVLVFIVAAPTGDVACSSSNPTRINTVSNNIDNSSGLGSFVVTNTSGGAMTDLTITGANLYGSGAAYTVDNATWAQGTGDLAVGNHTIYVSGITTTGGTYNNGTFGLSYTDPAGLTQSVTVTCQNFGITVP